MFYDSSIEEDKAYYYAMFYQDNGWRAKDDSTWTAPSHARERKLGCIYINPQRMAAVYFWPSSQDYSVFNVGIN